MARFAGIGDALFINSIAAQKGKETRQIIWIATNHKEIFKNNKYVRILPFRKKKYLNWFLAIMRRFDIKVEYYYLHYYPLEHHHILTKLSEITLLKQAVKLPVFFGNTRITALPRELQHFITQKRATETKKIIAIQTGSNTTWTQNKSWYPDRFKALAKLLMENNLIVQIGLAEDPEIESHYDTRGKLKKEQVFALMNHIDLFIGTEGYIMHAAAAVRRKSVIVFGGFQKPEQSGYAFNNNIYTPIACAPCFSTLCTNSKVKECMDVINVEMVQRAVLDML